MRAPIEPSVHAELSRVSRQRSLVFRWVVKVPLVATSLVGAALLLIDYIHRDEEKFLPPGLAIAAACSCVLVISVGVGMLLAFVLCRFDRNRNY